MGASARRLRELLASGRMVTAPFVFDALQAKLAESVGFEAVYMTGFGTAAARGLPDLGLLSMNEMAANARGIAGAVGVPAICDADTGYGNAVNVQRTVREFEDAGAAAIHLEDQVWPKRCGFLAGKEVIPLEEHAQKIRAATEARRDPDFVVIARTDALAPLGWDEAERRARAYRDAGADLLFVDGIRTLEDLETYARRLGDLPLLYNGQLLPAAEIAERGFALMIHSASLHGIFAAVREVLRELHDGGTVERGDARHFGELLDLLGVREALEREKQRAS
jgi:2-methylisocitrate lyase-like PEP mutase family enzyme